MTWSPPLQATSFIRSKRIRVAIMAGLKITVGAVKLLGYSCQDGPSEDGTSPVKVGTVVGLYLANIPATDAATVGDQERLYPARFFLTLLQTRIQ
jgi:hypothetical protein